MASIGKSSFQYRWLFANAAILCAFALCTLATFVVFPLYVLTGMALGDSLAKAARRGIWRYARTVMQAISPFVPVRLENADMVKRHAPCILVANHQSFLDLYLFGLQDEPDLCMITKSWPFRLLFFFSPAMHTAGYINVEGLGHEEAESRALQRLNAGATVIFFPEGSRSRDGTLGRFHSGAFRLALRSGRPVVPLLISGSGSVFAAGAHRFVPGPIVLRFLDPVEPQHYVDAPLPHRAMLKATRTLYQNHDIL